VRGHTLCRVLQVSRAAYYDWSCAAPSTSALANGELLEKIRTIHARSRMTYGAPRVHDELRTAGVCCSRKRVARLMRQNGIAGRHPKRFRWTTVSNPFTALPDLVQRNFAPAEPDQLWVTDITCVRTGEGWLYLAVVLDCFSRRVVGWAMQDNLGSELTLAAMRMALLQRQPRPGLIHHSDRGCQYTSDAYESCSPHTMCCRASAVLPTATTTPSPKARAGAAGHLRVDRGLLQPRTPSLRPRQRQPRGV
jgi:transposase InsO family protein